MEFILIKRLIFEIAIVCILPKKDAPPTVWPGERITFLREESQSAAFKNNQNGFH